MTTITVHKRDFSMKPKQLRRSGMVPATVFGGSLPESIALQLDSVSATKPVRDKREGSRLELSLDGEIISARIKKKSLNPLNHEILHLSFQALKAGQKVNSVIHILFKNTEVLTDRLEKMAIEIPYASLPRDMIDTIIIDVDGMSAGTLVTVTDIPELNSKKTELQLPRDEIVFRIVDKKGAPAAAETEEESAEA